MKKRNFSAEFKSESAQLVVDQKYTVADAAKAMDVGLSTMTRWVKQLRDERQGKTPKASPITPEQIEIRKLRKKLQRIEMENEILKKAAVDSIGQRNSYVKTWGCGGFLNETNIYSRGKSLCFELWKNGTGFSEIANILGSKPGTIFTMLRDTGGIKPHERKRAVAHLTLSEREEIRAGLSAKMSIRAIATALNRSPSTISREVQRNRGRR
ncbi:helix-turn-helix domain-containing protein, partial [Escherichia coli]